MAKSGSRSTQSSKVTSVKVASRKLTESSLQLRNVTRRSSVENACTPARTQPDSQASVNVDSAMSAATKRVSPNHMSEIRQRRSDVPSNVTPVTAHSTNRDPDKVTSLTTPPSSESSLMSTLS